MKEHLGMYYTRTLHSDNFDEHSKRIYWSLMTAAAPSDSVFRALCTNLLDYLLTYSTNSWENDITDNIKEKNNSLVR